MSDETLQSRLHFINQKDFKTKTDIGMTVLSQNRPDCRWLVTCPVMLYTDVTCAVCVSKMSIVFTQHHEYNFICTHKINTDFLAPVFMKCLTYFVQISHSRFHSNGIKLWKVQIETVLQLLSEVWISLHQFSQKAHSLKVCGHPLCQTFFNIRGIVFFYSPM